jgi:hypothetical protein
MNFMNIVMHLHLLKEHLLCTLMPIACDMCESDEKCICEINGDA